MDEFGKRNGNERSRKSIEPGAMHAKGKKKRLTCFNCGKVGHIKSQCHAPKKEKVVSNNEKKSNKGGDGILCAVVSDRVGSSSEKQTLQSAHTANELQHFSSRSKFIGKNMKQKSKN